MILESSGFQFNNNRFLLVLQLEKDRVYLKRKLIFVWEKREFPFYFDTFSPRSIAAVESDCSQITGRKIKTDSGN